jgi:hypothetical protein
MNADTTLAAELAGLRLASTTLSSTLDDRLGRLAGLLEPPAAGGQARAVVEEVRALLCAFKTAEAQHVRLGLADRAFGFEAAQEGLGSLRRAFADVVRAAIVGLGRVLAAPERAELERVALVAGSAPLTSRADLEGMRAGRAGTRRAAVA